nr:MAG TPA: hypothetical protein [Caudoviricetes sp.]
MCLLILDLFSFSIKLLISFCTSTHSASVSVRIFAINSVRYCSSAAEAVLLAMTTLFLQRRDDRGREGLKRCRVDLVNIPCAV